MSFRWPALTWVILFLAGCGSLPPNGAIPPRPARDSIQAFALEARFSAKVATEGNSGRMTWSHEPDKDSVLFLSPLGQGVATLTSDAFGASLELADHTRYQADNPDELVAKLLGRPLPVRTLHRWVLGKAGTGASRDALGRLQAVLEDGWRVEILSFESEVPEALPSLLRISKDDLELKLKIDGWSLKP